jgi:hypothetical protein
VSSTLTPGTPAHLYLTTNMGDKNHVSMRYEYGNVKPPM